MNRSQYNRALSAIQTPERQAAIQQYMAGYDTLPEVVEGRIRMRHADQARDIETVRDAVIRFTQQHPVLAKRHQIDLDGTWAEIAQSLYACYVDSARAVGGLVEGHGSFITDVDPHDIQAAWLAASRLS